MGDPDAPVRPVRRVGDELDPGLGEVPAGGVEVVGVEDDGESVLIIGRRRQVDGPDGPGHLRPVEEREGRLASVEVGVAALPVAEGRLEASTSR